LEAIFIRKFDLTWNKSSYLTLTDKERNNLKMKPVRLLALYLLIVFLTACRPVFAGSKPTASSPETSASGPKSVQSPWTLTYTRSGGFAGISESVKIGSDGSVHDSQGQAISAPAEEVEALIAEINALDFSSFDDAYGNSSDCRDCYTYTLTFEQGGETKTITIVEDGSSELPTELQSLLQKLNAIAAAS
jgi:hypothetical protein